MNSAITISYIKNDIAIEISAVLLSAVSLLNITDEKVLNESASFLNIGSCGWSLARNLVHKIHEFWFVRYAIVKPSAY
jgi:hypothetical protein